ncbi:MAG: hypothetical protein R3E10_14140 [Gemmatimonadota bacterium]
MSHDPASSPPGAGPHDAAGDLTTIARIGLLGLLGLYQLRWMGGGGPLSSIDLAIHEAGHLVFMPFGDVVGALGGTLLQLIVPAAFVAYFLRRGDHYAAAIPFWWVGENLWHIAPYVADARAQVLPLVGGGEHDWAFLLATWRLLPHDQEIAAGIRLAGSVIAVAAVILGLKHARGAAVPEDRTSDAARPSARTSFARRAPRSR